MLVAKLIHDNAAKMSSEREHASFRTTSDRIQAENGERYG